MNVWCHLPTIFKQRFALRSAGLLTLCVALITALIFATVSQAAPGINQTLSFQGRLASSSGGIVPDGYYNIQFKLYQDGAGAAVGNPGGTLKWTESYVNNGSTSGVQVKNGYFSVNLGSKNPFGTSVDWNQDTLWLSMNIAGSAATCTTFGTAPCTADGEMLPMKRMTSTPFALNAGMLGGKTAEGFIQNTTTAQTADFNITGTGKANTLQGNTSIIAPLFDTATSGGTLSIGTVDASTINMGTGSQNQTINIGTGSGNKATTIGNTAGSSSTLLQGGSEGVRIDTRGGFVVSDSRWGTNTLAIDAYGNANINLNYENTFSVNDRFGGKSIEVSENAIYTGDDTYFEANGFATFYKGISIQGSDSYTEGYALNATGEINSSIGYRINGYNALTNSTLQFSTAGPATVTAAYEQSLYVTGDESVTVGTSGGSSVFQQNNLYLGRGTSSAITGTFNIRGTDSSATGVAGHSLTLQGGNATVGNANGGNVTIDAGAKSGTGTAGSVNIGTTNATQINLGQNVAVAANKTLTLGTNSNLNFSAGAGNFDQSASTGTFATGSGAVSLNGNTTIANGKSLSVKGSATFQDSSNSTTAFQIQNTLGDSYFTADSLNQTITTKELSIGSVSNIGGSGRLFNESFESNSLEAWTNIFTGGSSTLTVDSAVKHNGKYAAKIVNNNGTSSMQRSITGANTTVFRAYVYVASQTTGQAELIKLQNNSSQSFILYRGTAGNLNFFNPVTGVSTIGATVMSTGAWHKIEMVLTTGSTTGAVTGYLNGVQVLSLTNVNTGTSNPVFAGIGDSNSGRASTIYFDDLAVDTVRPGDSSNLSVADGLRVSGNSSFGGDVLIQNAAGASILSVNTSTATVRIGTVANNITFSSNGQFSFTGDSRRNKTVQLKAEYANSVLDAGTGSNNSGMMTSSVDLTNRMNYYKWTTAQSANQSYDVVVQVPIPDDFSAWTPNPLSVSAFTSSTSNGTVTLEARDSNGTVRCNFVSVTPGSTGSWSTNSTACALSAGTYTAGDYMTLRLRMQSPNGGDVRIGNITLNYLSKY